MELIGIIAITSLLSQLSHAMRYEGYSTITVGPLGTSDDVSLVSSLIDHDDRLQQVVQLTEFVAVNREAELLVAPDRIQSVMDALEAANIAYNIVDTDQERQLSKSQADNRRAKMSWSRRRTSTAPDFFMTGEQINEWMGNMAQMHPSFVRFRTIGESWQGRPITGLVINDTIAEDAQHVFLHAGIHAREWITHASIIYLMNELITSRGGTGRRLRETYIWHLFPNINPDGYYKTHTEDRYWRKNVRTNAESECYGVDLNRNWETFFSEPGASSEPCSEIYHGPYAFSEPENRAIRDAIMSIGGNNILLYMDIHAYSQMILVPYGGTDNKPADYKDLKAVGDAAAAAIMAENGREFEVGTPPDIIYTASGGTIDWVKMVGGVKYVLSPELRPAQGEGIGFNAPPSFILPSGHELFAGVTAALDEAERIEQSQACNDCQENSSGCIDCLNIQES